jgi:Photosynthesis affected mutant 68
MSASWDPDREGSSFGWDEFQLNVQNIKDGLRRSNSNAILRDKMSNLSKGELQAAIQDLDQREKKNNRDASSSSSLQSKLQDELE